MDTFTEKTVRTLADNLGKTMAPVVDSLASRWEHESEFEDFNEYQAAVKRELPKAFTFVKMSKRPFGFTSKVNVAGKDHMFSVVARGRKILVEVTT